MAEQGTTFAGQRARRRELIFAGALLGAAGLMNVAVAVAAGSRETYAVMEGWTMYQLDLTGWGWVHGVIGLASLLVGLLLIAGRRGATRLAIPIAVVSALVDLLILPYAPYRAALALGFVGAAIRSCLVKRRPPGQTESGEIIPTGRSGR